MHSTNCIQQNAFNKLHSTKCTQQIAFNKLHSTKCIQQNAFNKLCLTKCIQQAAFNKLHSTKCISTKCVSTKYIRQNGFNKLPLELAGQIPHIQLVKDGWMNSAYQNSFIEPPTKSGTTIVIFGMDFLNSNPFQSGKFPQIALNKMHLTNCIQQSAFIKLPLAKLRNSCVIHWVTKKSGAITGILSEWISNSNPFRSGKNSSSSKLIVNF
jgi:hypothetical protein